jgi:integrase
MDINGFLAHQRCIGRARRTIERRAWSLGLWVEHLGGAAATVEQLETFLARFPAPQSRYSIRCDIHQWYRWLRRAHPDMIDPTDRLDPIRVPRRAASPIHADEVRRLLDELGSSPIESYCASRATDRVRTGNHPRATLPNSDRLVILLAAHAGLRVSEIARVRGEDVDLERRWLTVCGKGGHLDVVPISATLAAELERHPRHGRLFAFHNGQAVSARIRRLFRRHGIVGRPHDLRHSFGTEAAEASNGNIVSVQRLMRHAEVATTMRYVRPRGDLHAVVDGLYGEVA